MCNRSEGEGEDHVRLAYQKSGQSMSDCRQRTEHRLAQGLPDMLDDPQQAFDIISKTPLLLHHNSRKLAQSDAVMVHFSVAKKASWHATQKKPFINKCCNIAQYSGHSNQRVPLNTHTMCAQIWAAGWSGHAAWPLMPGPVGS